MFWFSWRPYRQGNNTWRPAAKEIEIEFPWRSTPGGFCSAASRQGSFPWRFRHFPWRFLAAKAIRFWCSEVRSEGEQMGTRVGHLSSNQAKSVWGGEGGGTHAGEQMGAGGSEVLDAGGARVPRKGRVRTAANGGRGRRGRGGSITRAERRQLQRGAPTSANGSGFCPFALQKIW